MLDDNVGCDAACVRNNKSDVPWILPNAHGMWWHSLLRMPYRFDSILLLSWCRVPSTFMQKKKIDFKSNGQRRECDGGFVVRIAVARRWLWWCGQWIYPCIPNTLARWNGVGFQMHSCTEYVRSIEAATARLAQVNMLIRLLGNGKSRLDFFFQFR